MSVLSFLTGCEDEPRRIDAYPFRKVDFAGPYLAVCFALATGEAIGFAAAPACQAWPLAFFALVVWTLIGVGWSLPKGHLFSLFLLGLTLSMYSETRRARVFDQCEYTSSPFACELPVEGRVKAAKRYLSFDSSVDGVDIRVMIRRTTAETMSNSVVRCAIDPIPSVGEKWHCRGWLERKARGERKRRRLWVGGYGCSAVRVSEASESSVVAKLRRLREALSENIGYGLSHDPVAADLDRAIILGLRADLPKETQQMFADAGTVHVFAISGLHVGVIAWLLVYLLMTVFFFPLRWVALPLVPLLFGYVLMIDSPPSAMRAAVMSIVYFAAPMFLRKSDSLVAWAVTFVIFHVLNPAMLMKVGSLLSFTVMLGILLFVRWAEAFKSDALVTWGVSVAAWLSGVAIAARVFERVTIGGLFANIVMIPLASLAVVLGFLGAVVGFVCPWAASHLNNGAALVIKAMAGISWMTSALPYSNLEVAPWSLWMCAGWYVGVVLAFWLVRSVYLHRREMI